MSAGLRSVQEGERSRGLGGLHAAQPLGSGGGLVASSSSFSGRRRTVDAATRAFHWGFAACFVGAFLTAESEALRLAHVVLGYGMAGLLAFRVADGFWGPRQVRWAALARRLGGVWPWLQRLRQPGRAGGLRALAQQGLHVLMTALVALVLLAVVPVTLSGVASFHDWGGPGVGGAVGAALGRLHGAAGEAMLALVLAHVGLLVVLSLWRRQNVARPMLTGYAAGRGPDLVRHNRTALAVLLWLALAAYGAWEWSQSPQGLVPWSLVGRWLPF